MKISNSNISLSSSHQSRSVSQSTFLAGVRIPASQAPDITTNANPLSSNRDQQEKPDEKPAALVELSEKGKEQSQVFEMAAPQTNGDTAKTPDQDKTMSTLKALLQFLKSISKNPKVYEKLEKYIDDQTAIAAGQSQNASAQNTSWMRMAAIGANQNNKGGTVLVSRRETFEAESEFTSFSAQGIAKTEDGRELSFNVDFSMSREFMHYTRTDERYIAPVTRNVCDPLVINVGADVASVSDQKFQFDLDEDGKEDSISLLGKGSGFLALDKNEDGEINDGSELFGTKSGDGFADLAQYDDDRNGWIDENDDVFDKLKIWFKNEDGEDQLLDLKSADVGAIYLGHASTEFSLKSHESDHQLNGIVRTSGLFLRESGEGAGSIQHVDLAL